jgi:deoxyribonuclease V
VLAITDVHYGKNEARAACVLAADWSDAAPAGVWTERIQPIAPYEPGAFYKRELPCLLAVLSQVPRPLEAVIIDGYVWLDGAGRRGLGAHLHEALGIPVIGIAKTAFQGSPFAAPLVRASSARPLFVTAAGMDMPSALSKLTRLHGANRLPTLLKLADRLARTGA